MRTVAIVLAVMGGFALLLPTSAMAQDDQTTRARAQFDAGVRLFDAANYRSALDAFQRAYDIKPHPVVRLNLASCYEKLDMPVEAYQNYEAFLEEMPNATDAQKRSVQKALRALRPRVGEVSLDGVTPADAEVSIDNGAPIKRADGKSIVLTVGNHTVRATKPGFAEASREITVRSGRQQRVTLALAETAPPPVAAMPEAFPEDDEPMPVAAAPADEGHTVFTTPVLISGGIAVVFAATAVVTGIMAMGAKSDFDDAKQRSADPSLSESERAKAYNDGVNASDRAGTASLLTDILIGGAVVAGGFAVYFALSADDDGDRAPANTARVRVAPSVDLHGGGVVLSGAF